jgi:serine/threonine-protein kinase
MKICPTCQRTYPDDFSLCPRDGTPLSAQATGTEVQLAAGLSRRFRIVRRLGQGGMGTVFLAEQIGVGNRRVALKVLNRKLLDDPAFLLRFQNEAGSTGRISHTNVVTIYESGQADDGTPYIAMQFLEGESLRQLLERRGALPVPEVAEILQQAARGLNAAHKLGIIHRDIKPDNIFLTHGDEEELVVKIVDFGIAKLRESVAHTMTGMVLGTPVYMSCEQASGMRSDELDARSDVYSLGVVVYEMLTGRVPFHSDTPLGYVRKHMLEAPPPFRAVAPGLDVPPAVEGAVMKALVKERDRRYASAPDFSRDFARAASAFGQEKAFELGPTDVVDPQDRVRVEQERLAREKAEAERREKEKAAADRAAREKAEQERLAREKAAAERREKDKVAAEWAALQKAEQERLAREKAEAERREKEKVAAERGAQEKAERERLAREKAEAERRVKDKAAAEWAAREKAQADRLVAEKAEADRAEREKAEREGLGRTEPEPAPKRLSKTSIRIMLVASVVVLLIVVFRLVVQTPKPQGLYFLRSVNDGECISTEILGGDDSSDMNRAKLGRFHIIGDHAKDDPLSWNEVGGACE